MFMHHIISSISLPVHSSYFALMHIGSPKEITLLEFEAEEENQEAPQQVAPKSEE